VDSDVFQASSLDNPPKSQSYRIGIDRAAVWPDETEIILGKRLSHYYSLCFAFNFILTQQYPDKMVNSRYVNTLQDELLLVASFFDMNKMVEIQPRPGSIYILSQSEPFNEQMEIDYNKLLNWLEICGLPLYHVHASGHVNPEQLKWTISEITPGKVYVVNTERPKCYLNFKSELFKPEK